MESLQKKAEGSIRVVEELAVGEVTEMTLEPGEWEHLNQASNDEGIETPLPMVDEKLLDSQQESDKREALVSIYKRAALTAREEGKMDVANRYAKFTEWAKKGMTPSEIATKEKEQIATMQQERIEIRDAIKMEAGEANSSQSFLGRMKKLFGSKE